MSIRRQGRPGRPPQNKRTPVLFSANDSDEYVASGSSALPDKGQSCRFAPSCAPNSAFFSFSADCVECGFAPRGGTAHPANKIRTDSRKERAGCRYRLNCFRFRAEVLYCRPAAFRTRSATWPAARSVASQARNAPLQARNKALHARDGVLEACSAQVLIRSHLLLTGGGRLQVSSAVDLVRGNPLQTGARPLRVRSAKYKQSNTLHFRQIFQKSFRSEFFPECF